MAPLPLRDPAAHANWQPGAVSLPPAVARFPCAIRVADALRGRGDLPDRDDAVQRAGQRCGPIRAAGVGLLETEARYAWVRASAETQRAERERAGDGLVPAVREQDRDDPADG